MGGTLFFANSKVNNQPFTSYFNKRVGRQFFEFDHPFLLDAFTSATILRYKGGPPPYLPFPYVCFMNKKIVITGGTKGLGLAIARKFTKGGFDVCHLCQD